MDPSSMLYFAYGSNLNRAHFRLLCPEARSEGQAELPGYRLVFRHFADIEPAAGATVQGGLWRITPRCEEALDHYEEVSRGLYRRIAVEVRTRSGEVLDASTYRMVRTDVEPPTESYAAIIAAGYADFGIDAACLAAAIAGSRIQETPGLNATRPDA